MLDDLLEKGIIKLSKPKRSEEVGRMADPKYCLYHRMVNHTLETYVTLKEHIMWLAKDGMIILELDDVDKTNHIFCQIKGLSVIRLEVRSPLFCTSMVC